MMASAAMMAEEARLRDGKGIACPFCEREMRFNGVAWFCRSDTSNRDRPSCCGVPDDVLDGFHGSPEWELGYGINEVGCPQVPFAAIVVGDVWLAEFRPTRGHGGRMNLGVFAIGADKADLPHLIQEHGWTWQDWIPVRFIKEVSR
jgi:hypothetical protein